MARPVIALAIAILIAAKMLTGTWAVVLGIGAVVFLLTRIIGFGGLYVPFKISTSKK
jgi:hypothetical protein